MIFFPSEGEEQVKSSQSVDGEDGSMSANIRSSKSQGEKRKKTPLSKNPKRCRGYKNQNSSKWSVFDLEHPNSLTKAATIPLKN